MAPYFSCSCRRVNLTGARRIFSHMACSKSSTGTAGKRWWAFWAALGIRLARNSLSGAESAAAVSAICYLPDRDPGLPLSPSRPAPATLALVTLEHGLLGVSESAFLKIRAATFRTHIFFEE